MTTASQTSRTQDHGHPGKGWGPIHARPSPITISSVKQRRAIHLVPQISHTAAKPTANADAVVGITLLPKYSAKGSFR